jgi:hypothetical protein
VRYVKRQAYEYEVEKALLKWYEFLHQQTIQEEIAYSFYHSSFQKWLGKQLNLA